MAETRGWPHGGGGVSIKALAAFGLLGGLYVLQLHNYLLFHSVVEMFSIAVAAALFMLAWNARSFMRGHFLLWIAIGYLAVGLIDLVHVLSYRGMSVLGELGTNPATQLWVAARYLQALVLLTAPVFLTRRICAQFALAGFGAMVTLTLLAIFAWDVFPTAYDDALGRLTPFKIASEYVICSLLLAALGWLWYERRHLSSRVLWLMVASIAVTLTSEVSFTLYGSPYGPANLIGHYLKVVAFYLIYKALVETGLRRPYELLFRDLRQREAELMRSEDELRALNESLEQRVAERTEQVRAMARDLCGADHQERCRVAGVIHEDIQQALAACRLHLAMARRGKGDAEAALQLVDSLLAETLETCRALSTEVAPSVVEDHGLPAALEWLVEQMERQYGMVVRLEVEPAVPAYDGEINALLVRATRDLLRWGAQQRGGRLARLSLSRTVDGGLALRVRAETDGHERADALADAAGEEASGLGSVIHRLGLLGGRCEIDRLPDNDTCITFFAPAPSDATARPPGEAAP
ncbi:MAG: MASE3 domain-containing protein [Armatimonadota bacterium]